MSTIITIILFSIISLSIASPVPDNNDNNQNSNNCYKCCTFDADKYETRICCDAAHAYLKNGQEYDQNCQNFDYNSLYGSDESRNPLNGIQIIEVAMAAVCIVWFSIATLITYKKSSKTIEGYSGQLWYIHTTEENDTLKACLCPGMSNIDNDDPFISSDRPFAAFYIKNSGLNNKYQVVIKSKIKKDNPNPRYDSEGYPITEFEDYVLIQNGNGMKICNNENSEVMVCHGYDNVAEKVQDLRLYQGTTTIEISFKNSSHADADIYCMNNGVKEFKGKLKHFGLADR